VATDARTRVWPSTTAAAAFALGALALAVEAAVHIQQYATVVYGVRWIGPLFIANAVLCVVAILGLANARTRQLAALGGVMISAGALASLVVSYGRGLFGFFEVGFRAAIVLAVVAEVGAVVMLTAGLAAEAALVHVRAEPVRAPEEREAAAL
jgi:hypothetical protein